MTTDINMDLLADNSRLKEQVRELHDALGACLPLAEAWADYYCADGYGRQGRRAPVHQEILDKGKAALKETVTP